MSALRAEVTPRPPAALAGVRVLVLTTVPVTIESFLLPHVAALRAAGCEVLLACSGEPTARMRESGAPFTPVPLSRRPAEVAAHAAAFSRLRTLLRRSAVDVVYVHTPIAAAVARAVVASLPEGRRPAVVYFAHGFHFLARGERDAVQRVWYAVERALSRWTDQLVVINGVDRDSVRRWPIAREGKVRLVPGVGVDASWFDPDEVTTGGIPPVPRQRGERRVLCVGEFTANKRQGLLLEAVASLPRTTVVFAGDGVTRPAVEEQCRRTGLGDRVRFLGQVPDVRPLYAWTDVTVLVSRREGLPRAVLESLCMGVPVAVTETRGAADLARAVGCPVARDDSPAAVAAAVQVALADPRPRAEIRETFLRVWAHGLQDRVDRQVVETVATAAAGRWRRVVT